MRSALIAVFANIILNLALIWFLGTGGLAAATAICSYLQVAILIMLLRRRLGFLVLDGLASVLVKTIAATLCMSAAIAITLRFSKNWDDIFRLLLVVPAATAVFLLAAKSLHIKTFSLLTGHRQGMDEPTDD
jgi:peptidoglycan biosynthesis protein MviN/MurJ (putative lipid II flippase)